MAQERPSAGDTRRPTIMHGSAGQANTNFASIQYKFSVGFSNKSSLQSAPKKRAVGVVFRICPKQQGSRGIQGRPKEKTTCAFPRSIVSLFCFSRQWRYPFSDGRQIPTSKALRARKSRGRRMTCANESCSIVSNNWKSVSPILRGAQLPHNRPRARRRPQSRRLLRNLPRQRPQLKSPRQRRSRRLRHGRRGPSISAAVFLLTTLITPTIRRA